MSGNLGMRMSLPLLGKELTEQAARKRTYVLRVVYAALLFAVFLMMSYRYFSPRNSNWQSILGSGTGMFQMLLMLQFAGIYLFLPAMMSQTIAEEKERETLALLFLTDMGPWELLLQKYLGRLIPMFSFLLLSVPLMAIAYSFGGITTDTLRSGLWYLLLTCLQAGAFALMCSAFCRTPVAALVMTYLGGVIFYTFPVLVWLLLKLVGINHHVDDGSFSHVPLCVFYRWGGQASFLSVLGHSIPVLVSALLFLLAARIFLVRRAFGSPRNLLLPVFGALDRVFARWNVKMGGIVMWKEKNTLPDEDPVAWRELQKKAMGKRHYLCRLCLLIEVPILILGFGAMIDGNYRGRSESLVVLMFATWVLAALAMTVQGANAIVGERTHQTLDVLLTTPLSGREIIRQKMRALRRFGVVLAVPLLTLAAFQFWCPWKRDENSWLSITDALLAVATYLPLLAWLSLWIGLRVRTRFRAIMTALLTLVVWSAVPPLLVAMLMSSPPLGNWSDARALFLLSPAAALVISETEGWRNVFTSAPWGMLILNYAVYAGILFALRWACLRNADRYLRQEEGTV